MASVFPLTLGAGGAAAAAGLPPEAVFNDPYAQQIAEMQARLAKQQQAPMFTPEQVQQRRSDNDRQYALGLLGQLSGDQSLGEVGGTVLKQALAQRAPRITEKGVADPITGQFNYDPDYIRQRDEAALAAVQNRSAAARANFDSQRLAAADRAERDRQHAELLRGLQSGKGEALMQVQMPDGSIQYVPRSQAAGMTAPPRGGPGNATEGERGAAGYALRMNEATKLLDKFEAQGRMTMGAQGVGAVPYVGSTLQRNAMTPAQQLYRQASMDWIRAKLRKESGASIGKEEEENEYRTYFPLPGEPPVVVEQKRQARAIANASMMASAGRAALPEVPPLPGTAPSIDVGAALGRPGQRVQPGAARPQALPKANPQPPAGANRVVDAGW
jgi:hypothetical protein